MKNNLIMLNKKAYKFHFDTLVEVYIHDEYQYSTSKDKYNEDCLTMCTGDYHIHTTKMYKVNKITGELQQL